MQASSSFSRVVGSVMLSEAVTDKMRDGGTYVHELAKNLHARSPMRCHPCLRGPSSTKITDSASSIGNDTEDLPPKV